MEEKVAILMADLAGYTALTETHGAMGAAEIIEKYLAIVAHSLSGNSYLHENTGDEVMIVSDSADDLLATAKNIMRDSLKADNFLLVHGGLHVGKVIKRNDKYFGTAVNLTARITAQANPGTFWCTEDFIESLAQQQSAVFQSIGIREFKNLRQSGEIFELVSDELLPAGIDPVCKMLIREKEKAVAHPLFQHLFFCDTNCRDIFIHNKMS